MFPEVLLNQPQIKGMCRTEGLCMNLTIRVIKFGCNKIDVARDIHVMYITDYEMLLPKLKYGRSSVVHIR